MTDVRGKRVLVVGLGRSGRATAHCFRRRGAVITVTDTRPPSDFRNLIPELIAEKIGLELGLHREETFLDHDLIVVSPGVPWDLPPLQAARKRGIPVVPEIEAASWFLGGNLVGVTGSNGKTTTTALLGKMLQASGFPTFVGGNIGVPLISAVDKVRPDAALVTELSSFQLEGIQLFRPRVAVLLNITPNHLDRHPSFDAYIRAKAQIFRNQTEDEIAVLNADDPAVMSLAPAIARSRKIFFSLKQKLPDGVFVANGHIVYRVGNLQRVLMETRDVQLRGAFNIENVLAASAVACVLGADFEALRGAVQEFRGVEHRLEHVREVRGVEFYNDSKATSVDATVKALSAFERGVHLILGGKDKGAPYAPLGEVLEGRVRYGYLIGAAAERIAKELKSAVELIHAGDLETAVRRAFELAEPGDVVLLAPACSSFDQFQDFEHRGRAFKDIVARLAQDVDAAEARRAEEERVRAQSAPAAAPVASELQPVESESGIPETPVTREVQAGAVAQPAPEEVPTQGEPVSEAPLAEPETHEAEVLGEPVEGDEPAAEPVPAESREAEPAKPETATAGRLERATPASEEPAAAESSIENVKQEASAPDRREPVYVYEVSAEEVAPLDFEAADSIPEEQVSSGDAESSSAPEVLEDEALPFEVRPAPAVSATTADDGGSGEVAEPTGEKPGGAKSGQSRLPGI